MNISEAFPDTITNASWDYPHCSRYTNVEDAYEHLMQSRVMDISPDMTIESVSLDSVKLVNRFQEHKDQHKTLGEKIEELEKRLKDVNTDFASMSEAMMRINVSWGKSGLTVEESKPAFETWETFADVCKKRNEDMMRNIQNELTELRKKRDDIEENMAAMRKCVLLGVQMMIPEEKVQKHLCPVCFDQEVNMVLIPCGHTACAACTKQIGDTCMSCRRRVNSKHTLFFSA